MTSTSGHHDFDYLVIATGHRSDFAAVPGLGPGGNAYTITTLDEAVHAGEGWRKLLENPGPVVVGAAQAPRATAPLTSTCSTCRTTDARLG